MTTDKKPDIELSSLREIAGKATPGPWLFSPDDGSALDADAVLALDGAGEEVSTVTAWLDANAAAHIAAFDPPTVLALLDRIEELESGLADSALADQYNRELTRRLQAEAKLTDIRELHRRIGTQARSFCVQCDQRWPCRTAKTLKGDTSE